MRENVERATNEVVQSSYQRLATKRSISSNRRGRNYRYNSYYWVPRHVKIENERRADEIDIHGILSLSLSLAVVESFSRYLITDLHRYLASDRLLRTSQCAQSVRDAGKHREIARQIAKRAFLLHARSRKSEAWRAGWGGGGGTADSVRGEMIENRETEREQYGGTSLYALIPRRLNYDRSLSSVAVIGRRALFLHRLRKVSRKCIISRLRVCPAI